jgi:Spy/CpxP family protein refolding chaperone
MAWGLHYKSSNSERRFKTMKKYSLIAAFMILFASFGFAMAQPDGKQVDKKDRVDRKYHHKEKGRWSPYRGLNLTEEQKAKVDAMTESMQKELAPVRTELIKQRMELDLLWMDDSPNADKIKTKQKEIRDLRGIVEDKLTDLRLGVLEILTPEQRLELLTKKSKRNSFSRLKKERSPK